jgi:hypothetical protein
LAPHRHPNRETPTGDTRGKLSRYARRKRTEGPAHRALRAFLVSGESFDLLPIKHEQNVKREVASLVESWAESGFLVHGRFIYPWHQVKHVEVTQVEEMPLQLAHQRFDELYAAQRARMQEDFWRTRRKAEKPEKQKQDSGSPAH